MEYSVRVWIGAVLFLALFGVAHVEAAPSEGGSPTAESLVEVDASVKLTRSFRHDASLADVCFSSPSCGWAVGDRGVIWHTIDGGTTWKQQESNVECRLTSVCFVDEHRGWAVGGDFRRYTGATRGVVLRTMDGGLTWTQVPKLVLPLLNRVQFFDAKNGVAFGACTPFYPSGVFVSHDGGTSWQTLATDKSGGWLAGDFLDPDVGAFAGAGGQIATLARREVVHSPLASPSLRSFRAMRLTAPTGGWLVGDGGTVLTTSDAGRSWQVPTAELPDSIGEAFDFQAVAVKGWNVWIAGTPGSRVFHSGDGGKSWQSSDTGQTAPLRALAFCDEQHGFAVGDLGNILGTQDGGKTWRVQRSGGGRAALLAIFTNARDVPLELLAENSAADGYISAVDILHTAALEPELASQNVVEERTRESMLLAGASAAQTAWRFPLPPEDLALEPAELLAALNRENDGRAIRQLENYLVREIRTWRPEVIVVPCPAGSGGEGSADVRGQASMAVLAQQLVMKAVTTAADASQHVELTSEAGLTPWQVKKVFGVLPTGSHGDEVLATARFSPWLSASLANFAAPARALLFDSHVTAPDAYELKQLASYTDSSSAARGMFAGITLAPGSDARRPQALLPEGDLDAVRQMAVRYRHLQSLLDRTEGNSTWAGQVGMLVDGLPATKSGELLWRLAEGYRTKGQLDLAADTYFLLARRCPDHPLADQSLRWLVQFYASGEIAQRLKVGTSADFNVTAKPLRREGANGIDISTQDEPIAETENGAGNEQVQQANAIEPLASGGPAVGLSPDARLRRAQQLAEYLKTARPALYAEPSVRFSEVAAERKLGFANPAKRYFLSLKQLPTQDPWRQCAATEEWLSAPADQPPPKKLGSCRATAERPHLDGVLDEALWKNTDRLRLRGENESNDRTASAERHADPSSNNPRPAVPEVRLTYDKEFLYVAICCPKVTGGVQERSNTPRPRDADLSARDRVSLRLDVDRDFTTAYELTVDERGFTRDECWGDPTWNPDWYVAAASDEKTWIVEAAIPMSALTSEPPTSRAVWAVAARRTIPHVGYQCWSGAPADKESPEQFGMLIFE